MRSVLGNFVRSVWRKFFSAEKIVGDIRSATIGGVAGVLASGLVAWYFAESTTFTVIPSEDGFAQPLVELVDAAIDENLGFSIEFKPQDLRYMYICEYRSVDGYSAKETLISYISSYQNCLNIRQSGLNSIVIRPNRVSGELEFKDSTWQCKCGDL